MKFFIPAEHDSQKAERLYASIKENASRLTGWAIRDRRIYSIRFFHDGKHYINTVGSAEAETGEIVVAIFDLESCYLVCTPNRGVLRGAPMLTGDVSEVVEFES